MNGDMSKLDEMMSEYDKISPSFCMAKWMHASIHLMNGTTHSCYLPKAHKIPLKEVKRNSAALHNTKHKKRQRKQMLKGKRPSECSVCWDVENLSSNQMSDRKMRAVDSWTMNHIAKVRNLPWDADIQPTYVEVSFSHLCNFACTYCSPLVSSQWEKYVRKDGPYRLSKMPYNDLGWRRRSGLEPIDENNNPYIEAFWKWWPELVKGLQCFRVTGGEPLLSKHTYFLLEWIDQHPQPHLELEFNSNLGVPKVYIDRFLAKCSHLVKFNKIKTIGIHTSVDTYGKQAEYIRDGLHFEQFQANVHRVLAELPTASLSFMCTFNNLSVVGFKELLQWMIDLRQQYPEQCIHIDTPHLIGPAHQNVRILTPEYLLIVKSLVDFMEQNSLPQMGVGGFRASEISKMRRIYGVMKQPVDEAWLKAARQDFYLFFSQYDQRRGKSFLAVFPEMRLFWETCKHLAKA